MSKRAEACLRLLETHQSSGARTGFLKISKGIKSHSTWWSLQARGLHEASGSLEVQLLAKQSQKTSRSKIQGTKSPGWEPAQSSCEHLDRTEMPWLAGTFEVTMTP